MKTEEITLAEYRRLTAARRPRQKRAVQPPTADAGLRCPAGWPADYDRAGALGWQFTGIYEGGAMRCYGWQPTGARTATVAYLGDYATAAGCYREAVILALQQDNER